MKTFKKVSIELNDDEIRVVGEALRLFIDVCRINAHRAGTTDSVYVRAQLFMSDTAMDVRKRLLR